jgi:hypothetical protein
MVSSVSGNWSSLPLASPVVEGEISTGEEEKVSCLAEAGPPELMNSFILLDELLVT